jgi:hypothetical protein
MHGARGGNILNNAFGIGEENDQRQSFAFRAGKDEEKQAALEWKSGGEVKVGEEEWIICDPKLQATLQSAMKC